MAKPVSDNRHIDTSGNELNPYAVSPISPKI